MEISFMAQMQCMHPCHAMAIVHIIESEQDVFTWTCSASLLNLSIAVYAACGPSRPWLSVFGEAGLL